MISWLLTSSDAWGPPSDSSEATDDADERSPCRRGRVRFNADRSASPLRSDVMPEMPRIFDDRGRTCCFDSGIVFMTATCVPKATIRQKRHGSR